MKIGILGLPQSGKSTTFLAACGAQSGDGSKAMTRAIAKVPDQRLDVLAELASAARIVHAEVEFLDTAGLSGQGEASSAALKMSEELKLMDALLVVVDDFSGTRDTFKDIQALIDEMIINDLALIERNVSKLDKAVQTGGARDRARELEILKRCQATLESEKPLVEMELDENDVKEIRGYTFLSLKPLLIVINISEDKIADAAKITEKHQKWVAGGKREIAVICAKIEMELSQMEPDERAEFMKDLGISSPAVDVVIQKSYSLLGLIPYFTAGEKEARAWTVRRGTNAQRAAGVIHSDIERGFIRAEVISYDDYVTCKTPAEAKKQGKLRLEGKEYIVQDGDVFNFRFNV